MNFCSSSSAISISVSLRLIVFSGVRKNPRESCIVSVDPPCSCRPAHHVDPRRFRHAQKIHAAVFKEAPVFDRQHRLHHLRRNVVVLHQLAFRPLLRVEQRGHQLRLQFIR